jgi:hypothetical protein
MEDGERVGTLLRVGMVTMFAPAMRKVPYENGDAVPISGILSGRGVRAER